MWQLAGYIFEFWHIGNHCGSDFIQCCTQYGYLKFSLTGWHHQARVCFLWVQRRNCCPWEMWSWSAPPAPAGKPSLGWWTGSWAAWGGRAKHTQTQTQTQRHTHTHVCGVLVDSTIAIWRGFRGKRGRSPLSLWFPYCFPEERLEWTTLGCK